MVSLRRIEPEKNMARFYQISLQPTLFGNVAVVRHWGRIGGGGRSMSVWEDSEAAAQEAVPLNCCISRHQSRSRFRGGMIAGIVQGQSPLACAKSLVALGVVMGIEASIPRIHL